MITKYIERIDSEIAVLLERESTNPTTAGERDLHYLFENRKHAKEWAGKHEAAPMVADAVKKSYFGGA